MESIYSIYSILLCGEETFLSVCCGFLISSDSRDSGGETIDPSEMFFGGTVIYDN